jgi:hypothetical protein
VFRAYAECGESEARSRYARDTAASFHSASVHSCSVEHEARLGIRLFDKISETAALEIVEERSLLAI